jgi:sulfur carrier protein
MIIHINGEKETIEASLTVTQLLAHKQVKMPDMVSVELNGDILERQFFDTTIINDGDAVEFLYFMGGGQV